MPNSFGKLDTKGLLDIKFITGMPHILGFRRYKYLDSLVECISSALRNYIEGIYAAQHPMEMRSNFPLL